ncbi:PD-(D/E)XK nuclease family protein [Actinomyces radicidentis]|uniref:PD-(D/E)XK nuclease family protein n=1 Tax=Actinomyces radicidentis TaxID=111015 RepID=UPI0028E308C7|nr:PD-(D/E)XK nuclease family protein [Actinomyces radicidentis]
MHEDTTPEPLRLLPARGVPPLPEPGEDAARVLERAREGANLVVLGAAGTGRSTLALRLLAEAVRAGRDALLLAPTRARADQLRARAAHLLEGRGGGVVRVRTPAGFAFTVLTTSLTARPDPLPAPVLLAGAEEDAALAALIRPEQWPGLPPEAVASRAFRTELRNLLARAGELGVDADDLADLGRALDVPPWGPASALLRTWDAQGRPSAERRSETRRMDTARIQDRAVEALASWDADGVTEPRPVPDLVIVDDYQDCTAATARLLVALNAPDAAGHRAQVVVLGDPDVAVETFRGGSPSLLNEAEDRSGLAAERLTLGTRHRGGPALAAVWEDQAGRLPVTGTAAHRRPALAQEPGRAVETGAGTAPRPTGVLPLVASGEAQEAAHVARLLRAERIHHGTGWGEMAVIVRSSGRAQAVARDLRRRGVPLASSTPAVLLRAEPAASALLAVARAGLEGRLGGPEALPERPTALDLLASPLIGLSVLDLRRLRRRLRADRPAEGSPDENLLSVLGSVDGACALAEALAQEPLAEQAERLARAARVIAAVRDVVEESRGQAEEGAPAVGVPAAGEDPVPAGTGTGDAAGRRTGSTGTEASGRVDAEQLLWAAWDASGRAEAWRATALSGGASHADALLAEAAERDLDVVTALFKRAEIWAERHPGADAADFLTELAEEVLPSDSVAPQGVRPDGVPVLTPAAAAGREWEVVAVMGLGRDAWPDLRLRDSLTRSGLLVDAVTGRLPLGADGAPSGELDAASARAQVRADERRMLLSALTRATRRLVVTATQDEDHAPSAFLLEVARSAGAPLLDEDGAVITAPDVGDLTLRGLVGELRRAAVAGALEGAEDADRDRGRAAGRVLALLASSGVATADPASWDGIAGPTSHAPLVEPGRAVRVSPSDVEGVGTCPLRWFLQRQGGDAGATGAQSLGIVIHEIGEQAQREGLRGEEVMTLLEERLPELSYPDTWFGSLAVQRARDLTERLASYLDGVPGRVDVEKRIDVELELPLPGAPGTGADGTGDAPLPLTAVDGGSAAVGAPASGTVRVHLGGRIDRIEHVGEGPDGAPPVTDGDALPDGRGARVRVMDLKTGGRPKNDPARHAQLATYRLALEHHGYDVVGAGLVQLGEKPLKDGLTRVFPKGAALDASPDPETGEDWASDMVASAALDASGAHLEARTGAHCQFCPGKSSCPAVAEGRRVLA